MTGFLCRAIFRVRAEISIFGEIYTSVFNSGIFTYFRQTFSALDIWSEILLDSVAFDSKEPNIKKILTPLKSWKSPRFKGFIFHNELGSENNSSILKLSRSSVLAFPSEN